MLNKLFLRLGLILILIASLSPADAFAWKVTTYKEKIGPLKVNDLIFTIAITNKQIQVEENEKINFGTAVESFEIEDNKGRVHYKKHFTVEFDDENGFTAETSIKGFVIEGKKGRGLLLYYDAIPSAPGSVGPYQIFSLEKDRLLPIALPITSEGEMPLLPEEAESNSLKILLKDDLMVFNVWTGNFSVIVPMLVDWNKGNIRPLKKEGEFKIEAKGEPVEEEGIVRLFATPSSSATSRDVSIKPNSRIKFLKAYCKVLMRQFADSIYLSVDEPWLKITIDGLEGWIRDEKDLNILGLPSAG